MFPWIRFTWLDQSFQFPTTWALWGASVLTAMAVLHAIVGQQGRRLRAIAWTAGLPVLIGAVVLAGARLFHVIWERPDYFLAHPGEIFTRWDGLTFYGGLIPAIGVFAWILRRKPAPLRQKMWAAAAISTALIYSLLRFNCFATGCCWGKLCKWPWAVRFYNPEGVMPLLGIPVHPVQLYDSALSLLHAGLLVGAFKIRGAFPGFFPLLFLIPHALIRLSTEFFRADRFRGVDLIFSLSTSQVLSIGMILFALAAYAWVRSAGRSLLRAEHQSRARKPLLTSLLLIAGLSLAGCIPNLPTPPEDRMFREKEFLEPYRLEKLFFSDWDRSGRYIRRVPRRNLLWIAVEKEVQERFAGTLKALYGGKEDIRVEDVAWWRMFPRVFALYDTVIRIPYDHFNRKSLRLALTELESLGREYDVILLTHGMRNNIAFSSGLPPGRDENNRPNRFLQPTDIRLLADEMGSLRLNLVYMSACDGDSFSDAWLQAGARSVLAFEGLHSNYFYIEFFLNAYAGQPQLPRAAAREVERTLAQSLRDSAFHRFVIQSLVDRENRPYEVESYLEQLTFPVLRF